MYSLGLFLLEQNSIGYGGSSYKALEVGPIPTCSTKQLKE
jgi:hypothetical protein